MKKLYLSCIAFLFVSVAVFADLDIENERSKLPQGTQLSFIVQSIEPEQTTIAAYNPDFFTSPASVQKLVTALAALLELGPDFRFKTELFMTGSIYKNRLNGNLILKTSGDPSFTKDKLSHLLSVLQKKGIKEIKGNIIIDTSVFGGHNKASGWSWNNLTSCYNAPPSAAIINGNCFFVDILSAPNVGELASFKLKPDYPVKMEIDVVTVGKQLNADEKYCEFNIEHENKNHYLLTGCLYQNKNPITLRFAVQDGAEYLAQFIKKTLADNKIKFIGKIEESKKKIDLTPKTTLIATTSSYKLPILLNKMLKQSDNMIADTVFRTIGAHYYKTSGTWLNSSHAVKAILKNKAQIDLENAVIEDGSGLSRLNLIDANKIMAILQYIAQNDADLKMISMLPVSGKDGTLLYRSGLKVPDLKLAVSAKTGHLTGVYNMAGFLKQPSGHYLAFVQLISGYNASGIKTNSNLTPLAEFEQSVYQQLLTL